MAGFSFVAILAMGQAFPILVRGIDLSIGAIVGLVGMVVFDLALIFHWPGYLILVAGLLVGIAAGAVNGMLIVYLRLQPFIATLATLAAYRGLTYTISGRQLVPGLPRHRSGIPGSSGIETYYDIGGYLGHVRSSSRCRGFRCPSFIMLVVFVFFQTMLLKTRFGRDFYSVGGNVEAARLAGIKRDASPSRLFRFPAFAAPLRH